MYDLCKQLHPTFPHQPPTTHTRKGSPCPAKARLALQRLALHHCKGSFCKMSACFQCSKVVEFDEDGVPLNAICKNIKRVREKASPPVYCCIECNRLSARIFKLQATDPTLKNALVGLTKTDKANFYHKHSNVLGADLAAALKSTATSSSSTEDTEKFKATGEWLDEEDLNKKYGSKPSQLQSVKDKSRTMVHPTRGCLMYEDMTFVSEASNETKRKEELIATIDTEEKVKRAKKETLKKEKLEAAPADKPLSENGKIKYEKLRKKIDEQNKTLADIIKQASEEKYKEYVGPMLLQKSQEANLEADAACAAVRMMLEDGWKGKASEVEKDCRSTLEKVKMYVTRLGKQCDEAVEIAG